MLPGVTVASHSTSSLSFKFLPQHIQVASQRAIGICFSNRNLLETRDVCLQRRQVRDNTITRRAGMDQVMNWPWYLQVRELTCLRSPPPPVDATSPRRLDRDCTRSVIDSSGRLQPPIGSRLRRSTIRLHVPGRALMTQLLAARQRWSVLAQISGGYGMHGSSCSRMIGILMDT